MPAVFPARLRCACFFAYVALTSITGNVRAFTKSGAQYTTDGSQSDVIAAIADAAAGDTINVPTGTFSWGGATAINVNKPITLRGAGDATIIQLQPGGFGTVQLTANGATVGWLKFIGKPGVTPLAVGECRDWRITEITYDGLANGGSSAAFAYLDGNTTPPYGVIDNCRIFGGSAIAELIFARGPPNAWQQDDNPGTADALYVEDCTFGGEGYVCDMNANMRAVVRYNTITGHMKIDGHGMDSNTPARSVRLMEVYGNTWTNGGSAAIEMRGGTGFLFDNTVTNTTASAAWFMLVSYAPVVGVWPNYGQRYITASVGSPATITTPSAHGLGNGWPVYVEVPNSTPPIANFYTATVTSPNTFTLPVSLSSSGDATFGSYVTRFSTPMDYPLPDQIGVGKDPTAGASSPMYLWNNTAKDGADWTLTWKNVSPIAIDLYRAQTGNSSATFTLEDIIAADRDYFKGTVGAVFNGTTGVGRGTKAQMNALSPTKVGVGFWVTDEGDWNAQAAPNTSGRLYVWNGSAWTHKYTPYAYPHPLRTSSSSAVTAAPTFSPPAGTYMGAQTVSLSSATSGASVRYTLDGSVPSATSSLYTGPITVAASQTIKAVALRAGSSDSPVATAVYTIAAPVFTVNSPATLANAIASANAQGSATTITLEPGVYTLGAALPTVTVSGLTIRGPAVGAAIIDGAGVSGGVIFTCTADRLTLTNLTLRDAPTHAVRILAGSDQCVISNCTFSGGHSAIEGNACGSLSVIGNTFRSVAQIPAVQLHSGATGSTVTHNLFLNCHQAVALGRGSASTHVGGRIENNFIADTRSGATGAPAILLESCSGAEIQHNSFYLAGTYPHAMECRYPAPTGNLVRNNLSNKAITASDGGVMILSTNHVTASASTFVDPSICDLHLVGPTPGIVNAGTTVPSSVADIDGDPRPPGAPDIGADEYVTTPPPAPPDTPSPPSPSPQSAPAASGGGGSWPAVFVVVVWILAGRRRLGDG